MSTPSPVRIDLDLLGSSVLDAIEDNLPSELDVDDILSDIADDVTYNVRRDLIENRDTDNYGDQPVGDPIVPITLDEDITLADVIRDSLANIDSGELAEGYTAPYMSADLGEIHDSWHVEIDDYATEQDLTGMVVAHGLASLVDTVVIGWLEYIAGEVADQITVYETDDIADAISDAITVGGDAE